MVGLYWGTSSDFDFFEGVSLLRSVPKMLRGFLTGGAELTLTGALLLRLAVIDWEVAEVEERAGEAGVDSDLPMPLREFS